MKTAYFRYFNYSHVSIFNFNFHTSCQTQITTDNLYKNKHLQEDDKERIIWWNMASLVQWTDEDTRWFETSILIVINTLVIRLKYLDTYHIYLITILLTIFYVSHRIVAFLRQYCDRSKKRWIRIWSKLDVLRYLESNKVVFLCVSHVQTWVVPDFYLGRKLCFKNMYFKNEGLL